VSVEISSARVARDLMTSPVVTAKPDTNVRVLAHRMMQHHLGALPIVDDSGAPIGMVSDGDLFGRRPEDKRRVWWLGMLARGGEALDLPPRNLDKTARELMSAPVVTVSPSTPLALVAEILQLQNLKRLPVVEQGRIVGVISRTDLIRIVETLPRDNPDRSVGEKVLEFLESLVGGASLRGLGLDGGGPAAHTPTPSQAPASEPLSAAELRQRMRTFQDEKQSLYQAERLSADRERKRRAKALLDEHVSAHLWRSLLEHAEAAAANGENELLMLRFPCDLCSDGGRMIDVAEAGWETTLRGEAAELFNRWRQELKPKGFHLSARVVSYDSDGVIGDLGLFLSWGD